MTTSTLTCSLYKHGLLQQGARQHQVDRMVEEGFPKWFQDHVSQYTLCL
jgi:hypothetical protein